MQKRIRVIFGFLLASGLVVYLIYCIKNRKKIDSTTKSQPNLFSIRTPPCSIRQIRRPPFKTEGKEVRWCSPVLIVDVVDDVIFLLLLLICVIAFGYLIIRYAH